MIININNLCKVRLTTYGKDYLRNKYNKEYLFRHNTKNDVLTTELWDLMSTFGDILYMGNNYTPFVSNEIEVLVD